MSPLSPADSDNFSDFVAMTVAVWRSPGQVICAMFPTIGLGLWFSGQDRGEVSFSVHDMKGTYCPRDLSPLLFALTIVFIRFPQHKVTLPPPSQFTLTKRRALLPLLERVISTSIIWKSSAQEICLFFPICLFMQSLYFILFFKF